MHLKECSDAPVTSGEGSVSDLQSGTKLHSPNDPSGLLSAPEDQLRLFWSLKMVKIQS